MCLELFEACEEAPLSDCPCRIENDISTRSSHDALVGVE